MSTVDTTRPAGELAGLPAGIPRLYIHIYGL